jgi:hypothetical protein
MSFKQRQILRLLPEGKILKLQKQEGLKTGVKGICDVRLLRRMH